MGDSYGSTVDTGLVSGATIQDSTDEAEKTA